MTLIYFILILGITILVHEFGHFICAKKFGVYCYEFSIGMGPRLLKFKRKNDETEYSLRILPLGGYVAMAGEGVEVDPDVPKGMSLQDKSALKRFIIMVAGVTMNFITALIIYIIIGLCNTVTFNNLYINENSLSGINDGDKIVSINNHHINNYDKLNLELALVQDNSYTLGVKDKNGEIKTIDVDPIKVGKSGLIYGLDYGFKINYTNIYKIQIDGIKENSIITKINDVEVNTYNDILVTLNEIGENKFTLTVKDDEKEQDIKITPKKIKNDEVSGYAYGFSLSGEERSGFLSGIRYGFFKFGSTMEQMYFTVLYLCTGKISLKMLSGPVGIYNVVSVYSTYGLFSLLGLLALICINVGFINILPLPAMDGGHIFFILIEKIKGSKVDPKIENKIHNIGLILLLILMVVITFNDILRLI